MSGLLSDIRFGFRMLVRTPLLSVVAVLNIRDRQTVFRDLGAGTSGTINISGDAGPPERFQGGFVTANAFDGLGVPPLIGRSFQEGDDVPGAPGLLLLGFDVWTNRFGADANIVGTTARVNGETATVIGVMPEGFACWCGAT